jgi:Ca-activated chloride channel family protein
VAVPNEKAAIVKRIPYSLTAFTACLLVACSQPVQRETRSDETSIAPEPGRATAVPAAPPAPPMEMAQAADGSMARSRALGRIQVSGSGMTAPRIPTSTENYAPIEDNGIQRAAERPVSTFSIDVDTGSYANVRRMLNGGQLPPADAVRVEEFINYFDYGYTPPATMDTPFSVTTEMAPSPWNPKRHLLLVGIKGYEMPKEDIPAANLVFLIDSSGSMQSPDKLGLLKQGFAAMAGQLRSQDRVAIVAYAGSAGLVLPPTAGSDTGAIVAALDSLQAGGSTNGGAGIELAYAVAKQQFIDGGVNRVILASDGDFNVGTVSVDALATMVADKRRSGIGLTVLGFGGGNLNDHLAEQLANTGNGNYFYIDTFNEGRKVLVDQLASTVLTIAEDVKIQIEFNPSQVEEYRLIGYENRLLEREDFNNDRVDAGEIGAGHNVTALYEISLVGSGSAASEPLRYGAAADVDGSHDEIGFLRLRYKVPGNERSELVQTPLQRSMLAARASERLEFAAAVAGFADALRGGTHLAGWSMTDVGALADGARGHDPFGYRGEFSQLVERARSLSAGSGAISIAD